MNECEYCKVGVDKKPAKGRTRSKYFYKVYANGLAFGCDKQEGIALLPAKFCPMCGKEL